MNKLAIIGGSGLYKIDDLDIIAEHKIDTPFGTPSAPVVEGKFTGAEDSILFLPRHGLGHAFTPSEINYRANIWALKSLGARKIIGFSAIGSLRKEIKPGDIALISQYFDHTRGLREYSFFGSGVIAHVSTARPACPALTDDILSAAKEVGIEMHTDKAYGCVEGPRLGTQIESHFLRGAGCDVVGMTNVPEAFLAREAQMGYCTIGIATDYDCWLDDPDQHAQADEMLQLYFANIDRVKTLVRALATKPLSQTPDWITTALTHSIITPPDTINDENKTWLSILQK